MPLIKLSALLSDVKGVQGGSIWQRNPGGLSLRVRTNSGANKTLNAGTAKRNLTRLRDWAFVLTNAQRDAWQAQTPNYITVDKYGNPRQPSGYELFCRLNLVRLTAGLSILIVAPAPGAVFNPGVVSSIAPGGTSYTTNWTTPLGTNDAIFFYAHRPLSRGRKLPISGYKLMTVAQTLLQTSQDVKPFYDTFLGSVPVGSRIWLKAVPARRDKGIVGQVIFSFIDV